MRNEHSYNMSAESRPMKDDNTSMESFSKKAVDTKPVEQARKFLSDQEDAVGELAWKTNGYVLVDEELLYYIWDLNHRSRGELDQSQRTHHASAEARIVERNDNGTDTKEDANAEFQTKHAKHASDRLQAQCPAAFSTAQREPKIPEPANSTPTTRWFKRVDRVPSTKVEPMLVRNDSNQALQRSQKVDRTPHQGSTASSRMHSLQSKTDCATSMAGSSDVATRGSRKRESSRERQVTLGNPSAKVRGAVTPLNLGDLNRAPAHKTKSKGEDQSAPAGTPSPTKVMALGNIG